MGANEPKGMDNLEPSSMVDRLYVGTNKHYYILNIILMVLEKKILDYLSFSHCKSMGAIGPQMCDQLNCLNPRGLIGRIYVGNHYRH